MLKKTIKSRGWTITHAATFFEIRKSNFFAKLSGRVKWTAEDEDKILKIVNSGGEK